MGTKGIKQSEIFCECESEHEDCFANKNRFCMALRDTYFGKHDCPFYKTRQQVEKEEKIYGGLKKWLKQYQ